jgi:uncharacterized protein (TIGR00266 family)
MEIEIRYRPAYALGVLKLAPNEQARLEGGAMVSLTQGVQIATGATGGFWASLKRSFLGNESFFQNTFTAPAQGGEVTVASSLPGDLSVLAVKPGQELLVQSGSFIAAEMAVTIDTQWAGGRSFFGNQGLFMLRAGGQGQVVVASFGAMDTRTLGEGEVFTVDTGHLMAFSARMPFNVRSVGGMKSLAFSGEGLVCDVTGPGTVVLQTRSPGQFLSWLIPQLPFERQGSSQARTDSNG